ncbi:hypothetical protein E6B08_22880 [Pseudomonas putida]|uniref:Uncharacterized protein n=1 Tax=Pseudomonas putida TaxID=303 RepID=A0A4D6XEH5_PSEPU|nr:hypothetical protein E6B08_22880 [Pseudomonas putida]
MVEGLVQGCQGGVGHLPHLGWLGRPLRGQARSYRNTTVFKACMDHVGAGLPAKRPALLVNYSNPCAVCPTAYPYAFQRRQRFSQLCRFRHAPCRKPSRTLPPCRSTLCPTQAARHLQERGRIKLQNVTSDLPIQ